MVIKVKGVVHAEAAVVHGSPIERLVTRKLLHRHAQRPARRCPVTHEEAANVGEEVVAALGDTLQHERRLKLVTELVGNTSLVVTVNRRAVGIQEGLGSSLGEMDAELVGVGEGTRRVVVDECGIVEIARIEGVAASQKPGRSCLLAIGHRLADAGDVLFPDRQAVRALDRLGDFARVPLPEDGCPYA